MCSGCGVWFQDPMPPKVWHGSHEAPPNQMTEGDKRINEAIADWLFGRVMHGKPGRTLDVGAAYPYLAYCLLKHDCEAWALDGQPVANPFGVREIPVDFEQWQGFDQPYPLALITFVHSFEHTYDPVVVFQKLRKIIADDGAIFIRMPDNQVAGYERDLTAGHYTIHPFFHALSSIAELCARTGAFRIEWQQELQPGQRDMILRVL
jgi:hypothetical protein